MKKFSIVIIIITLVFIIVACGDAGKETKTTPIKTVASTAKTTKEASPTVASTPVVTRVPDPEVDGLIFKFFYEDDYGFSALSGKAQCDYEWVEGKGLAIYPVDEDPWVMIDGISPDDSEVNILDYPVFKARIMNQTPSTTFELFLKRTGTITSADIVKGPSITANSNEYIDVIIDLSEVKDVNFLNKNIGVVTAIRFDVVNLAAEKATVVEKAGDHSIIIYVDYFGFFKTVEEATEWIPVHIGN